MNIKFLHKITKYFSKSKYEIKIDSSQLPIAYINVQDLGVIEVELYPHIAPNTVNNFIYLSNKGFYNNLTFHRIIKNFIIQGGCPNGNGMGGPGYCIEGEFNKNKFRNNLKHTKGILSMARSHDKNSAGSQFFIVTKSAPHLNGKYASFGKVINGMDLVHKIENSNNNENRFIIKSIKIDTKGKTYNEPIKL